MKAFIWMILELMVMVFGIYGFGLSTDVVLAFVAVAIVVLAILYFAGIQFSGKYKFFEWFMRLFGE